MKNNKTTHWFVVIMRVNDISPQDQSKRTWEDRDSGSAVGGVIRLGDAQALQLRTPLRTTSHSHIRTQDLWQHT